MGQIIRNGQTTREMRELIVFPIPCPLYKQVLLQLGPFHTSCPFIGLTRAGGPCKSMGDGEQS